MLAALLVTVGGLRLLAAAEGPRRVDTRASVQATAVVPRPASRPPVYEITAADFLRTVEHTARVVECTPEACGFSRVRHHEDASPARRLVHRPVTIDWVADLMTVAERLPASWIPGGTCGLACPELLRTPDALAAEF